MKFKKKLLQCAYCEDIIRANVKFIFINQVLKSVYLDMKVNQLHIDLSKCAHMYFKPNINNNERMSCARSQNYDINLKLSIN